MRLQLQSCDVRTYCVEEGVLAACEVEFSLVSKPVHGVGLEAQMTD